MVMYICYLSILVSFLVFNCIILITSQTSDEPPTRFIQIPSGGDNPELAGNRKLLFCEANGVPSPIYHWLKNGNFLMSTMETNFLIASIQLSDTGDYQCIANNSLGSLMSPMARISVAYILPLSGSSTFESVSVIEGQAAVIDAPSFDSKPTAVIKWFNMMNNAVPTETVQYHQTLRNQLVVLSTKMDRDNGSIFKAVASNRYTPTTSAGPLTRLHVHSAGSSSVDIDAEIVISPVQTSIIENVDRVVQFECVANARPMNFLYLSWYKKTEAAPSVNRTKITADNQKYELSKFSRVLTIHQPTRSDSGIYVCEAVFSRPGTNNGIPVAAEAKLVILVKPSFVTFPPLFLNYDVDQTVSMRCTAYGIPSPSISWYRNAELLNSSYSSYELSLDGVLMIRSATVSDSGVFQCFAINDGGQIMSSTWLQVSNSKPVITLKPENQSVVSDESVRFDCRATGAPLPTIHWYKVMSDGSAVRITTRTGRVRVVNGEFLITNTNVTDSSMYICNASNSIGFAVSIVQLQVFARTRIVNPPQAMSAIKGTTVELPCGVAHDSSVTVVWQWFVEEDEIQTSDARLTIDHLGTLHILSVRNTDIGTYTCFVTSDGGVDTAKADVTVIELPHPPSITSVTLSTHFINSVDITWTPGFDGNSPLLRYVVHYCTIAVDGNGFPVECVWRVFNSNLNATAVTYSISSLQPAHFYQFRLIAVNKVGESEPSVPSKIVNLPEQAPSGPPLSVSASPRSNSSIILQWNSPDRSTWNGELVGYLIRYKPAGYPDSTIYYNNVTLFQPSIAREISGLIIFQEYQVSVAAYNRQGLGVYSSWIWVRTREGRPTAPPVNLTAQSLSSTSITLSWFPPNPQYINGISQGYHVDATMSLNGSSMQSSRYTVVSNISNMLGVQTMSLNQLYKYVEYQLTVSCFTSAGNGPHSSSVRVRTLEDVPDQISSMAFTDVTDTSFTIIWSPPIYINGILTGYVCSYTEKGLDVSKNDVQLDPSSLNYTVTHLTPNTLYSVEMKARTRVGSGPSMFADIKSGLTPVQPMSPRNLAITNIQSKSVLLQFEPGFNGYTSITEWIIESQTDHVEPPSHLWTRILSMYDPDARSIMVPGLRPYTAYRLRMIGVNVAGQSAPSQPTMWFDTLKAVPSVAPSDVTVRSWNETCLLIRWIPLSSDQWNADLKGYVIRYIESTKTNATYRSVYIDDENANSFELNGLDVWVEYTVLVAAFNEVGIGNYSSATVSRTRESVPSAAPSNIRAEALSSTCIQVTWLPVPTSMQHGLILGYKVIYQSAEGAMDSPEDASSPSVLSVNGSGVSAVNITGLEKFVIYTIEMLAFTSVGDGIVSEPPVSVKTFEDVPGPPSSVYFPIVTQSAARIVWSPPMQPNGIITGYKVAYGVRDTVHSVSFNVVDSIDTEQRHFYTTNLDAYKYYTFSVTARTQLGWGQPLELVVYTVTNRRIPDAPGQPTTGLSQIGDRWIVVDWVPGSDGYSPIRNYTIQQQISESGPFISIFDHVPANATEFNITRLRPNCVYKFRIAASNDIGQSTFSLPSSPVTTLQAVPDSPPIDISASCDSSSSVVVSWMLPPNETLNGPLTGFDVAYRSISTPPRDWQLLSVNSASQLSMVINELSLSVLYEFKVRACNNIGHGSFSQPIELFTELPPSESPQNVIAINTSDSSTLLVWQPPSKVGSNGNILGYKIYYWPAHDDKTQVLKLFHAVDTSIIIKGLMPHSSYSITILAFNAAGDGPVNSPPVVVNTLQSVPEAPGFLKLIVISPTSVNVTWSQPARSNGIILSYELSYDQVFHVDGETWKTLVQLTAERTSYIAQHLIEGMDYIFTVRSRTAAGWGIPRISNITIGPQPGCPRRPGRPLCTVDGKLIYVEWAAADVSIGDPPISGYIIQTRERYGHAWDTISVVTSPETSAVISFINLKPSTDYQFRLFALSEQGLGLASQVSEFIESPDTLSRDKPFYQQWWFLVIVALSAIIIILIIITILCFTGRHQYQRTGRRRRNKATGLAHSIQLSNVHLTNQDAMDDSIIFPTFDLELSTRSKSLHREPITRPPDSVVTSRVVPKSSRSSTLAARSRSPPRRSPGRMNYTSDDDHKSSRACSSSLSDKHSESSTLRSQGSDSETECHKKPPKCRTMFAANRYANNTVQNSWHALSDGAHFNPYSLSDSETDNAQSTTNHNGGAVGQVMINNVAGSRAPIPGFSSFV